MFISYTGAHKFKHPLASQTTANCSNGQRGAGPDLELYSVMPSIISRTGLIITPPPAPTIAPILEAKIQITNRMIEVINKSSLYYAAETKTAGLTAGRLLGLNHGAGMPIR